MRTDSSPLFPSLGTALLLPLLMLSIGCGSGTGPDDNKPDDSVTFEGIIKTTESGQILDTIGDVSDDWAPAMSGCLDPGLAYPNPADRRVGLRFTLCVEEDIKLWLESKPGTLAKNIFTGRLPAGSHSLDIDIATLPAGTYRAFMEVTRTDKKDTSYGDIMIAH